MSDQTYTIESTSIGCELRFEGDSLSYHMVRKLKECRVDQITKVVIKTAFGLGEEISIRIYFLENGKEKKFQPINALVISEATSDFLDDLKSRISTQASWEDKRDEPAVTEDGSKVYDLQFLPFGWGGAGLGRGVQIWIYTICFAVLILPLFYFIPLIVRGGYRIYCSDSGLEVRKFGSTKFNWESLDVGFQKVRVVNRENYSSSEVMKVKFSDGGKTKNVAMRYDHVVALMKELVERGVLEESVMGNFA